MKPRKDPTSLSTQLPHSHSHSHGQPHHRILIDKSNDPVFIPEPRSRSAFGFTAPWSSSRRSFPGMGMGMGGGHSGGRVKDEWTDLGSGSGSGSAGRRGWRDVLRVYHSHPVLSHHVSSVGSNQPLPIIVIPTPSNTDKPPPPHPPHLIIHPRPALPLPLPLQPRLVLLALTLKDQNILQLLKTARQPIHSPPRIIPPAPGLPSFSFHLGSSRPPCSPLLLLILLLILFHLFHQSPEDRALRLLPQTHLPPIPIRRDQSGFGGLLRARSGRRGGGVSLLCLSGYSECDCECRAGEGLFVSPREVGMPGFRSRKTNARSHQSYHITTPD